MSEINLDRIQAWIDAGRLDPTKRITPREIHMSGLIGRVRDGVKLLARDSSKLKTPIDVLVSRASASAIEAIEKAGGKITTRYYTKDSIKKLIKGVSVNTNKPLPVGKKHVAGVLAEARKRPFLYRLPDPTSRREIEYYRDPAHRGYLSHMVQPGQSPSLYFRVPGKEDKADTLRKEAASKKMKKAEDKRLF